MSIWIHAVAGCLDSLLSRAWLCGSLGICNAVHSLYEVTVLTARIGSVKATSGGPIHCSVGPYVGSEGPIVISLTL